jgi:outer membrane protein assembly factor BamB
MMRPVGSRPENKDLPVKSACLRLALVALSFYFLLVPAIANENWPQWRGPTGNGISDSKNLPTTWSLETNENIVWKTELPSWSGSTPIIWGDHIFVMSPSKSEGETAESSKAPEPAVKTPEPGKKGFGGKGGFGRPKRDPGGPALLLVCLSKKTGAVRWQREIDRGNETYQKQNSSSPSPVTDGKHVWTVTGNGVVTALDFDGNVLWKKELQKDYGAFGLNWGYGSSPLLYSGNLVIEVLHGMKTDDPSYLIALEGDSGKVVWRQERPTDAPRESPDSYTTPTLANVDGQSQIVVAGGDYLTGHDPRTGQELWRAGGLNPTQSPVFRTVNSPVVSDGIIYIGTRNKPLLAFKIGAGGVKEQNLAWKWDDDGGPDVPTPVTDGKYFYMVADGGLITVIDAKTGKQIYQHRLSVGATIDSSPLLADGKLYVTGENSATVVLAAGPEYKELARNELDGSWTLSSIAVSGQQLFVRTGTHLYCIGNKTAN